MADPESVSTPGLVFAEGVGAGGKGNAARDHEPGLPAGGRVGGGPSGTPTTSKGKPKGQPKGALANSTEDLAKLKALWRKKGACFACGSESHRIAQCSIRAEMSTAKELAKEGKKAREKRPKKAKAKKTVNSAVTETGGTGTHQTGQATEAIGTAPWIKVTRGKVTKKGAPAPATVAGTNAATMTTSKVTVTKDDATQLRGKKRTRDTTPSGLTPPPKKSTAEHGARPNTFYKRAFNYARVTSGAREMVILRKDGGHITQKAYLEIIEPLEKILQESLENDGTPFQVDGSEYNTQLATITPVDEASTRRIAEHVNCMGYDFKEKSEVMEARRPSKMMSGLAKGISANLNLEVLNKYVQHFKTSKGITGSMEIVSSMTTKTNNAILKLKVDDLAAAGFLTEGNTLRLGMAGLVLFCDIQPETAQRVNNPKLKTESLLADLDGQIAVARARIETLQQKKVDLSSVGSVGLSGLNMDTEEEGETNEKDAVELITIMEEGKAPEDEAPGVVH